MSSLSDIPTLAEAGIADYEVSLWIGIAAPAGTPPSVVSRLNQEMTAILASPEITDALIQQGMTAEPGSPQDLGKRISSDVGKWRAAVSKVGIKAE